MAVTMSPDPRPRRPPPPASRSSPATSPRSAAPSSTWRAREGRGRGGEPGQARRSSPT
ncbi:MAG: hypothetical protein MZV65_18605 [Chromatiales bacterium]|nr:hypothetical protein [Chromatiales bacterium]